MIELIGRKDLKRTNFVDHINSNKLNNRRQNLRVVTREQNSRNKSKSTVKNVSSTYFGARNIYRSRLKVNSTVLHAYYKDELHAAHQYNLWVKQYNLHSKTNDIQTPESFIQYKKQIRQLPQNIVINHNQKYQVNYKSKYYGSYSTLKEALLRLNEVKKNIEYRRILEINNTPIKRNDKNECIIELFDRQKKKVGETIVDEDMYYDLVKYSWCLSRKYVVGTVDNKTVKLHRFVLDYSDDDVVDHINNDRLDNRKCNLRVVTPKQNNMNKLSRPNSSSKFIGVTLHKYGWTASIGVNGERLHLGYFKDETEAAKARDIATKEHFGEFGNLNFPDEI